MVKITDNHEYRPIFKTLAVAVGGHSTAQGPARRWRDAGKAMGWGRTAWQLGGI